MPATPPTQLSRPFHVLVTGAAGFVPSHVCDRLLADGHRVIGVDNFLTGRAANVAHLQQEPGFALVAQDVAAPDALQAPAVQDAVRAVFGGRIDAVMHLASPASPVDYYEHPLATLDVGSLGTRNALALAHAHDARFLLASTSEVYGDPTVHPQPESYWGHVNPVGERSCYDEAKRFAEALTMTFHRARETVGWAPRVALREGLHETLAYFREALAADATASGRVLPVTPFAGQPAVRASV